MPEQTNNEEQQPQLPYRTQFINALANRFLKDMDKAIYGMSPVQALEVVEHLAKSIDILERYIHAKNEQEREVVYNKYAAHEEALVRKWGKLLVSYRAQKFYEYFDLQTLLVSKEVVSDEEYNKLEYQELSVSEMDSVIYMVRRGVGATKNMLLTKQPPSGEALELLAKNSQIEGLGKANPSGRLGNSVLGEDAEDSETKEGGVTKVRSRLALYFLLKSMGIEPRTENSVADVARLAHLLSAERFTTLPNSNIYKFFRKLPDYKSPKGRLADLKAIRPYFEGCGLNKVVSLIDEEIKKISEAL